MVGAGGALASVVTTTGASAAISTKYASCTGLVRAYPHGVGRVGATDRIAGTSRPVNTWRRDTAAYHLAMYDNRGLDRDRDRDNRAWVRR